MSTGVFAAFVTKLQHQRAAIAEVVVASSTVTPTATTSGVFNDYLLALGTSEGFAFEERATGNVEPMEAVLHRFFKAGTVAMVNHHVAIAGGFGEELCHTLPMNALNAAATALLISVSVHSAAAAVI